MSARPGWLMPAALGASLLLNLALGGYVVGAHLKAEPPRPERPAEPRGEPQRPEGMPEVSREQRREVRHLMRHGFEAAKPEFEARHEAEKRLIEVLRTDPFNREAAEAALRVLRDADATLRDRIGMEVISGMTELDSDQRAWVAYILSGPRNDSHHRRREQSPEEQERTPQQRP